VILAAQLTAVGAACAGWTIVDLGSLDGRNSYATAINNSDQVVGYSTFGGGSPFVHTPFFWENGLLTDLGILGGGDWARAECVNASGLVGGYSRAAPLPSWHAFVWTGGATTDLGSAGGSQTAVYGVNDAGWVVGQDNSIGAFYWNGTSFVDLDSTVPSGWTSLNVARAINDNSMIVGDGRNSAGLNHAFLYDAGAGTAVDLGAFVTGVGITSTANAISNSNVVVGSSQNGETYGDDEVEVSRAFVWESGVMTDLGTLGGALSMAFDVNESTQVVGRATRTSDGEDDPFYAFLWEDGVMTDLNDLLPPGGDWVLREARGINDLGHIVGFGTLAGVGDRAFLFIAEPPPPCIGDVDGNDIVDLSDLATLLAIFGTTSGEPGYDPNADFDDDGDVDLGDLALLLGAFGTTCN
jgi:probable HAF family extracellular repeat protein